MKNLTLIGLIVTAAIACSCSSSNSIHEHTSFSKADSLTDAYLVLSDSLLQSWNRIVVNEIDKSRTLQELIEDLDHAHLLTEELRESFAIRVDQLEKIRFTQETIADPQSVQDYDLALQSLIDDIAKVSKSPGSPDAGAMFKYLQENSLMSRLSYDSMARSFNEFVRENREALENIQAERELEAKPVFVKIK